MSPRSPAVVPTTFDLSYDEVFRRETIATAIQSGETLHRLDPSQTAPLR